MTSEQTKHKAVKKQNLFYVLGHTGLRRCAWYYDRERVVRSSQGAVVLLTFLRPQDHHCPDQTLHSSTLSYRAWVRKISHALLHYHLGYKQFLQYLIPCRLFNYHKLSHYLIITCIQAHTNQADKCIIWPIRIEKEQERQRIINKQMINSTNYIGNLSQDYFSNPRPCSETHLVSASPRVRNLGVKTECIYLMHLNSLNAIVLWKCSKWALIIFISRCNVNAFVPRVSDS